MWPGVSSLRAGPAPPPGPGLGLATPLAPPARGWGVVPVTTLGPKRATRGESSLPKAAFRVGVKTAGCIPGDKLGRVWGPWPHAARGQLPARRPRPSSRPGLGSGHAPSATGPGLGGGTCYHARPEKGHAWGVQPPQSSLPSGREDCRLHSGRQAWSGLGALAAMWPGVSSLRAGPAPPPGPGLSLATPLAPPARGWEVVPVTTPGPKKATCGGVQPPRSSLPSGREGCWLHSGRQA